MISASLARLAGALFMLLKEKEPSAATKTKRNGRRGRKEGSVRKLEGIVSVMSKNLQLAAGVKPRSKEFVVGERLAKFFGQKNLKGGLQQADKNKQGLGRGHVERTKNISKPVAKVEIEFTTQNF
jgi:phage-related protein